MTIEEAIRTRVLEIPDVSVAIGARAYPDRRPQSLGGDLPAVEVEVGDFDPGVILDGASGTIEASATLRVLATTLKQAETLVLAVRSLVGTSGTWGTLAVDYCLAAGERDTWDPPSGGRDAAWGIEIDLTIGFQQ